jgi:predicted transcriptional regulator
MAGQTKKGLNHREMKVLAALADNAGPLANKQIAKAAGLDAKEVTEAIKGLKAQGLVESPARGKYGLTKAGQAAL